MKLIIEIPIDLLERTKSGDYDFGDDLARNEVIVNGTPYNPSGDCISREDLKKKLQARHDNGEEDFDKGYNIGIEAAIELIDNAPTIHPRDNCDLGYVKGLEDGKDALIKELWNCRNELCLRCGKYEKAHRGACDDCRYNFKNMKQYKRGDDE